MNKARAAQIWDELERQLIEHCGLPNGRMLELARPGLIRRIGNALQGRLVTPVVYPTTSLPAVRKTVRKPAQTVRKSEQPAQAHPDAYAKRILMRPEMRPDTVHDPRLAELLERSCSRRTGYDGDDFVDYGGR
jgi:hypothetical protein